MAIVGATPARAPSVVLVDPTTAVIQELTTGEPLPSGAAQPEAIRFGSRSGSYAHALLHSAGGGAERPQPPLLVRPHPGPTANTQLRADPWVDFFTSQGFAVLDVDYGGSTGYGRSFRNSLRGSWGVLDVSDCVDAVDHLAAAGRIDPARVAICGSSAGGYTALRAVATTQTFSAAAVRHAIINPATWRQTVPKFQSHHADLLIAPPSEPQTYRERSVLHHCDAITAPVLIIHGEQDTVTPVSDARQLAQALGGSAALITFADEAHSLRHPDHARQALTAELAHLRRAFRF